MGVSSLLPSVHSLGDGLGFWVYDYGMGFRVSGSGFGFRLRLWNLVLGGWGYGFRVEGSRFTVRGSGFMAWGYLFGGQG